MAGRRLHQLVALAAIRAELAAYGRWNNKHLPTNRLRSYFSIDSNSSSTVMQWDWKARHGRNLKTGPGAL